MYHFTSNGCVIKFKEFCLFSLKYPVMYPLVIYVFVLLQVGIIGGSGLDNPDILENREEKHVTTPFGEVSHLFLKLRGNIINFFYVRWSAGCPENMKNIVPYST